MTPTTTRRRRRHHTLTAIALITLAMAVAACAKMGRPDGGWYDETPPRIVGCAPRDKATGVSTRKITIQFDEYVKMDNPTEKVVVSPPQMETPEIKAAGKRIVVEIRDSLKPNTTYTVDFSDAISDNNEGNPLGNYTYTFATGDHIDTLEVSGRVIDAHNLEPIKGMLVGLHSNLSDTIFRSQPLERVSRTDSRGVFVIKGVAPGNYRVYALEDADNDYVFNQKSERVAFSHDIITPTSRPDIRQDTIWRDSLRIDSIRRVPYTRFLPDDIVLRAFTEKQTDRYLVKTERQRPERLTLFFSNGDDSLPTIRGLNFDHERAFVVEPSEKRDTVTYWLRDSALINQDTLRLELTYMATDTTGVLRQLTDTLEMTPRETYEKRLKRLANELEEWTKQQEKAKRRGKPYEETPPVKPLDVRYDVSSEPDPDRNVLITVPAPTQSVDTARLHLYAKHDSLWYNAPLLLREKAGTNRVYELIGEWRPGVEYSLEVDTMAFTDIYGRTSAPIKKGFKVRGEDSYASIALNIEGMSDTTVVAQLLNTSDNVVKETSSSDGVVEFFYVKPGVYYVRMFIDSNKNGLWDTGDYDAGLQAETTYYYPEKIECRAKWDMTLSWNPTARRADMQKPLAITKQKPEKEKTIKRRNEERANKLGIPAPR